MVSERLFLLHLYVSQEAIKLIVTGSSVSPERRTNVAPTVQLPDIVVAPLPWLAAVLPVVVVIRVAPVKVLPAQGTLMVLTATISFHSYD